MQQIKLYTDLLGPIGTNCYTLVREDLKKAVVIDAAGFPDDNTGADRVTSHLQEKGASLEAVLLTHGHYDHVGGVPALRQRFPEVPFYIGREDVPMLKEPALNLSTWLIRQPVSISFPRDTDAPAEKESQDRTLGDGDILQLLGTEVHALAVPGHTSGSICYYFPAFHAVFDGDTLFSGSVGRSDFPTGNGEQLLQAIRGKLFTLPENTTVYPGHDGITTIGREKSQNVYFA